MADSRIAVVVLTSFNDWCSRRLGGAARHPTRSRRWIGARQRIWNDFTWPSLEAQTDDDFTHVVRYAPETLAEVTRAFSGPLDDRVRLVARARAAEERVIAEIAGGREQVVVVRLDSDDMLHPAVVSEIRAMAAEPGWEWAYWRRGYAASYAAGAVYAYDTRHVGPFFAHRYESSAAFGRRRTLSEPQHRQVGLFDPIELEPGRFVVGLTSMNTEASVASPSVGSMLPEPEAAAVRATFSLEPGSGWRRILASATGS